MKRENPYKDFWNEAIGGIVACIITLALLFCIGCLVSCSPKVVPIQNATHDTIYINKQSFDSIHILDSVYVNQYILGDTVYIDKIKWREYYTERELHDTIYKCRMDTLTVKVTEYKTSKKDEFFGVLGRLFLWIIIALLLYFGAWLFFGRKF